jgi:oligopeptide transport system permease protein
MLAYAGKRLLAIVPTLLLLATIAFALLRVLPGGPFDRERAVPAAVARSLDAKYHLDEPVSRQYARWLGDLVLRGDLGPTFRYPNRTVNEILALGLPVSATLGGLSLLFALAVGVPLGAAAAARPRSAAGRATTGIALIGTSMPSFVLAPVLILVFALELRLLPAARWGTWRHAVLPVICAGLPEAAFFAWLTRAGVEEALRSDFVRAARAKGLSEGAVLYRHALRAGVAPVIGYLGPAASGLVVGAVAIERIFDLPGVGRYFVEAALNRDYNLVLGVTLLYGAALMIFNTLADIAHALLDPRIKLR